MSSMPMSMNQTGLSAEMKVRQRYPAVSTPVPAMRRILYFPVRLMNWPLRIDAVSSPSMSGSVSSPLSVGVTPFTSWR